MNGIIYYIFHIESGKGYVGQHCRPDLYSRWKGHCKDKSSKPFFNAIRKYGKYSFRVVQIDTANSQFDLDSKEIYWIDKLETLHPNGYNLTRGGEGHSGFKLSLKARSRISSALIGVPLSLSHRQNISKGQKGRAVSEETRKKISEGNKGRIKSPEECEAISIALKGGTLSDEHKANISESLKGSIPWNSGIKIGPFTKEHIENRVNSLRLVSADQVQAIRKENPYRGHKVWAKELGVTSACIGSIKRYKAFPNEP